MKVLTFVCGNGNIRDQRVQFVGRVFVLITLPGQAHAHAVWDVPTGAMQIHCEQLNPSYNIYRYSMGGTVGFLAELTVLIPWSCNFSSKREASCILDEGLLFQISWLPFAAPHKLIPTAQAQL